MGKNVKFGHLPSPRIRDGRVHGQNSYPFSLMSRVEKSEADNITKENRPSFMRVQVQHSAAREKTAPFHIPKASVTLQLTSKILKTYYWLVEIQWSMTKQSFLLFIRNN